MTVPAHFSPVQRRAVVEAARAAGLQRVTLLQGEGGKGDGGAEAPGGEGCGMRGQGSAKIACEQAALGMSRSPGIIAMAGCSGRCCDEGEKRVSARMAFFW